MPLTDIEIKTSVCPHCLGQRRIYIRSDAHENRLVGYPCAKCLGTGEISTNATDLLAQFDPPAERPPLPEGA